MRIKFPVNGDVVLIKSAATHIYAVKITHHVDDGVYSGVFWYDQSIATRVHIKEIIANMSESIDVLQLI